VLFDIIQRPFLYKINIYSDSYFHLFSVFIIIFVYLNDKDF
jgi:hypothetical protein